MKITMDITNSIIDFEGNTELQKLVDNELHYKLSVRPKGYQFTPSFKNNYWDGYTLMHENVKEPNGEISIKFPTGLVPQVDDILGNVQNVKNFQYTIIDNRPDPFLSVDDVPETITLGSNTGADIELRDYQYDAVKSIVEQHVGILHQSTNSGKTTVAAGIIKTLLPHLQKDERIVFFTHSTAIFNQAHAELEERLGIKLGKYGSGKKDIRQVTVAMVPTINASLKLDPEKGVKLTAKERIVKRMAKEIAPKFLSGINQKMLMKSYVSNFPIKTKVDTELMAEMEEVICTSESDAKIKFKLNNYIAKYQKILETKNKDVMTKHSNTVKFLNSIAVAIVDEGHHSVSDSFYNTLMACNNAYYRVALTGSIDPSDPLLNQRLKAIFGGVVSRITNSQMIDQGVSAKPKIVITPINQVVVDDKIVDIANMKDYMRSYELGMVKNQYRNTLIAKITEMCYNDGEGILIIVNRIEHGQNIGALLEKLNIPYAFVQGEQDSDTREEHFTAMKNGSLRVMIATSLVDEGVSINNINSLIMASSGSMRQVLQRAGRVLRKKTKGENTATIFDFTDNVNIYLKKHGDNRRKIYEEEGFEIVDL